ncbi:AAA family ATPase [Hutsoniella sourekii]
MRINKIEIYGYGKWVNQSFELNHDLQLFIGKNESGKSTIQSFIRSILFGFPSKRKKKNQENRYEPRDGDRYGGRLLITDVEYGDLWIERTLDGLKINSLEGDQLAPNLLSQLLAGLDEDLYDTFYSFTLANLQNLSNIGLDDLNDYFLGISTLGSDKFLELAKQEEKLAANLYKRNGSKPQLNQLLNEYETLALAVDEQQANMATYNQLTSQLQNEEQIIEDLNQKIDNFEQELRDIDQLIQRYDIYLKKQATEKEREGLVYTPVPDNCQNRIDRANITIADAKENQIQLQERLQMLEEEQKKLTRSVWANNHEEDRKKWRSDTEEIKIVQTQLEQVEQSIAESKDQMKQLAEKGKFYPEKISFDQDFNKLLEQGLDLQAEKEQIDQEISNLQAQKEVYQDQRKEQQNNRQIANQQIAFLESKKVNEEAQLIQETNPLQYLPSLVALAIVAGLTVFQLLKDSHSAWLWGLIICLLIGSLGWGIYTYYRHQKLTEAYHQKDFHLQIKDLEDRLSNYIDQVQALAVEVNDKQTAIKKQTQALSTVQSKQAEWLAKLGFYPDADPEKVLKTNPVQEYFGAKDRLDKYNDTRNQLLSDITGWRTRLQPLLDRFPLDKNESDTRKIIRHFEKIEASLVQELQRQSLLEQRIQQTQKDLDKSQQLMNQGQDDLDQLLEESQASNLSDLLHKISENQKIKELDRSLDVYQDQIKDHIDALKNIKDRHSLKDKDETIQSQLFESKENLIPHLHNRANLSVEISRLEEDGSYAKLVQDLEDKKSQIVKVINEYASHKLTAELIYQTLQQGIDNPLPEMNQIATELFERFSLGRYDQIKMNKSSIKVRQFTGIYFEPYELSQGTLEQLYVAIRLAFIMSAKQMVQLPIIIDDVFVNFDDLRKASIYQTLEKIASDFQILFFTFDKLAIDSFDNSQQINLEQLTSKIETEESIKE